jgi:hypothetical protein
VRGADALQDSRQRRNIHRREFVGFDVWRLGALRRFESWQDFLRKDFKGGGAGALDPSEALRVALFT